MTEHPKFKTDNPGGEWLEQKKKSAESDEKEHGSKGVNGAVTGYFTHNLKLPVKHLRHIPGAMGEEEWRNNPDSSKNKTLDNEVKKHGFNTKDHPISIGINHRGKPYVQEGNHRLAHAVRHGHTHIHAEVKYYNGGEEVKGQGFHPDQVLHMHHHGDYKGLKESNRITFKQFVKGT